MPSPIYLVVYLVLGGVLGALGGLFGIGGGLIAIPVLALFFGLNQQQAQGTALVMVVPNVLVGLSLALAVRAVWRRARSSLANARSGSCSAACSS